jgi:hypothetical protein
MIADACCGVQSSEHTHGAPCTTVATITKGIRRFADAFPTCGTSLSPPRYRQCSARSAFGHTRHRQVRFPYISRAPRITLVAPLPIDCTILSQICSSSALAFHSVHSFSFHLQRLFLLNSQIMLYTLHPRYMPACRTNFSIIIYCVQLYKYPYVSALLSLSS